MDIDKKELARDVLALGSWVFYVLVIGRALIKPYRPFVDQLIIAGIILILLGIFIKKIDGYIARGLVLVFFTSLFYNELVYALFAMGAGILLVFSSRYVGSSWKKIFLGLVVGVISIAGGYLGSGLIF